MCAGTRTRVLDGVEFTYSVNKVVKSDTIYKCILTETYDGPDGGMTHMVILLVS